MLYNPPFYKQIFHNARRFIAKNWLLLQPALQIAITGSYGKTNVTHAIAKVLSESGKTVVTDINLDTLYNVPITALRVTPWTKYAIFELGIDHPREMNQHLEVVKPKIAVVTGISPVHTDKEHLGSLENLIKEKRKLIEALPENGYAILNWDDENVRKMAPYAKAKIFWYGTDPKHCHIWIDPKTIHLSLKGTQFNFVTSEVTTNISTNLIGKHHIYTIMASYLVAKILNIPNKKFIQAVSSIKPITGRMNIEAGPKETVILNDSLRANPASTASGLETFSEIEYSKGKKIAILAEMGELAEPQIEHEKIGKLISQLKIDYLILIGPNQKFAYQQSVKNGFPQDKAFWEENVFRAGEILKKIVKPNDFIYLKGSLHGHVERVLENLF